ncbi:MAG: hypothetical protein ACJ76V_08010 [Thermoleophilaceae bacterium]
MSEPRLSEHPRAQSQIRTAKGWGGIGGFLLAAWISHKAGAATPDLMLRSIMGGLIGWAVAWLLAVQVWRQLAVAEVRGREREWHERRARLDEADQLDDTMIMKARGGSAA